MRALLRTTACIAVLAPVALLVAAMAGAVTITSAGNTSGINFGNGISTSNVATAMDDPYCSGTVFGIRGTGFAWEGGTKSVMMGNAPAAEFTVLSDILLWARVGRGATDGPIVVTTGNNTTYSTDSLPGGRIAANNTSPQGLKPGIVVMDCPSHPKVVKPVITGMKPNPVKSGKKTELHGSGFFDVTKVTIGGKVATFAAPSDANLVVIVPKTAPKGKNAVVVTNSAGSTTATGKLTIK